ncbi:O-antigen ligase family protein [Sporolactobacillus laevolacticus]|uniref:O-antigen ligase family protein n=1 Tax=Sporolactobacillus laevolacticus TaxID=33018 RepID=UPI0025B4C8DD|nr:O-antigen ligase family protein [Sporolactobacillus laevolacticus]MDN3954781.1 O-antigen ligase family protein [Sporolactobacillus laevolacticus]
MVFLMYLAAFLFPLDNFPWMVGGAYRPVSVLFILVYILVHLPEVFRLKYRRVEMYIFVILMSSILISAVQCSIHHYYFSGLIDASQSILSGLVCYLGFKLFTQQNSENDKAFTKLFVWIIRGYALAVFVGLLQFMYIYLGHSGTIAQLIHLFVARDEFAMTSRVHFSFSEPSYISLHTNLFLLPAVIILKNRGLLTNGHKLIVFTFFLLSLFSLSVRYYIDIIVFIISYLLLTTSRRIFLKRLLTFCAVFVAVAVLTNAIFVQNIFRLHSDHYYRMANMVKNPSEAGSDLSSQIRQTYSKIGFESFNDQPLLGYGLGNFHYAYIKHYSDINPSLLAKAQELQEAQNNYSLVTYNMYARLSAEMGLTGFLLLGLIIYLFVSTKMHKFSILMIFLTLYSLLQFDSFALVQVFFWIAFVQSKYISELRLGGQSLSKYKNLPKTELVKHVPVESV